MKSLSSILSLALCASVFSLMAAYIAEYIFGLKPCHLCLLQRIPFAAVILLTIVGFWQEKIRVVVLLLIGAAFLTGAGVALYHAGVENHWVKGPSGCTDSAAQYGQSMEELLHKIKNAPVIACDQPQWEFHGITMAVMNTVWSLFLGLGTFVALWKVRYAPSAR